MCVFWETTTRQTLWETLGISEGEQWPVWFTSGQVCCCLVTKSRPNLCDAMDCSPPGSSVHGIYRQEYWSGLPLPPPGDLPEPGIEPSFSWIGRWFLERCKRKASLGGHDGRWFFTAESPGKMVRWFQWNGSDTSAPNGHSPRWSQRAAGRAGAW